MEEDPNIYEYDNIYDEMQEKKVGKVKEMSKTKDKRVSSKSLLDLSLCRNAETSRLHYIFILLNLMCFSAKVRPEPVKGC